MPERIYLNNWVTKWLHEKTIIPLQEHTDHNDVDEAHCDTDQTGAGAVNSKALSARETNRTGAGSSRKRPAEDKVSKFFDGYFPKECYTLYRGRI